MALFPKYYHFYSVRDLLRDCHRPVLSFRYGYYNWTSLFHQQV